MGHFINPFTDWGFKSTELASDRLRTDIVLSDKETHRMLTDKVRMIYLQLPYFTKTEEEHAKYDSSIKVLRDNIAVYQGALQKGDAKDLEKHAKDE